MRSFLSIAGRDLRLAFRARGEALLAVIFFVLVAALFPLALGPEPRLLARIVPGILWVAALLAVLLSLDRMFLTDREDGSLDLLFLAPLPLEAVVLAKVLAHWLASGLPLVVASPLIALLYDLPEPAYPVMLGALLLGTPALSAVGAVGAALTLGARRGGILLPLLVLPLYIPVLIFGATAIDISLAGISPRPHLLLLAAFALASLPLAAFAGAAALRQALD